MREHSYGNPSLFPLEITYKCIPPKDDLGGFWRNPGGPDNGVEIFGDTNVFPFSVSMFVYWRLSGEYLAVKKTSGTTYFPHFDGKLSGVEILKIPRPGNQLSLLLPHGRYESLIVTDNLPPVLLTET